MRDVRNELLESCRCSNVLRILYMSGYNVTKRTVRILKINSTTFEAFCYLRGEQRTFCIDNVLVVVPVKNKRVIV